MSELEKQTQEKKFWKLPIKEQSQVLKQIANYKQEQKSWQEIGQLKEDILVAFELYQDSVDKLLLQELEAMVTNLTQKITTKQITYYLSSPYDENSAIVQINSGSGGIEAMDWVKMLFRMYSRWIEKQSYVLKIIEITVGEEVGFKSITFEAQGRFAYGKLKQEIGVHRLVRISPFDSNKKRHTSFASVFVFPEVDENIKIDIKEKDLRIDTYRATGAGGQHVNTTDSAVRIVHLPTGIKAQCQNERSQHKNKATAMRILKSTLIQKQLEEKKKELQEQENQKKDISWGSQIRSYILQPYQLVKDHRNGTENGNTEAVLDGEIDIFIQESLRHSKNFS